MKNKIRGHQGDVQFRTINSLPKGAKSAKQHPIALGEHSGHEHILTGDVELFELNGVTYAAVGHDGATLQHVHESNFDGNYKTKKVLTKADHKEHKLPEGIYEFFIQGSYNPYKKILEKVID